MAFVQVILLKKILEFGMIAGVGVIIYGFTLPNSLSTVGLGFLILLGCYFLWFPINAKMGKEKLKHYGKLSDYMTYDKETQQLTIYKRDSGLAKLMDEFNLIQILDDQNYSSHVTPTKVHIGSATVGRVTTGGVYTTGGDTVVDGHYKTGKFFLQYCDVSYKQLELKQKDFAKGHIKTIKLMPSIKDAVRGSSIEQYVSGDCIIVEQNAGLSFSEIQAAMQNLNSGQTQSAVKRGYPTREKCDAIIKWLKMQ